MQTVASGGETGVERIISGRIGVCLGSILSAAIVGNHLHTIQWPGALASHLPTDLRAWIQLGIDPAGGPAGADCHRSGSERGQLVVVPFWRIANSVGLELKDI